MKGHIQQRGKNSFRLKFDAGRDDRTGKRKTQFVTFRGNKRQAQTRLAELIAAVAQEKYVEPSKITVAEYVRDRVNAWESASEISARTADRYRELVENQIVPHLGAKLIQRLRPADIEEWHSTLRTNGRADGNGGLAPRTIGHAHRVLSHALRDALRFELVMKNAVATQSAPKVDDGEMVIVHDIPAFIEKLGSHHLYVPAMIALYAGLRLGEVLALRWGRIHLDRKVIEVRDAIEETKNHGVRIKPPKSKAGRRDVALPDILVDVLRQCRKERLELRVALGVGKLPDDALLFSELDGSLPSQKYYSKAWSDLAGQIEMPNVTFHALRHTHASQLIDEGVDIVTISKRLGHKSPAITLAVYAHLFKKDDSKAAAAINAALASS
jgi:integrase